MPLYIPNK